MACGSFGQRLRIQWTIRQKEKVAGPTFPVVEGLACSAAVMLCKTEVVRQRREVTMSGYPSCVVTAAVTAGPFRESALAI